MSIEGAANELNMLARDLQVDQVSDRYEAAWRSGERPNLDQFLDAMPGADSRHLFRELLAVEVSYRQDCGETPIAEDYLSTYPQYRDVIAEAIPDAEPAGDDVESLPLPLEIGKYRVVGRLGLGGQAEVYRVVHTTLHHEMVLKLAARHASHKCDAGLIEAEGRLLAALEHPNLARVYDLGYVDGRPYLVMEYIRGCNLRQYVRQQPPNWEQSARWVAKLARAVSTAHTAGVIHRDIKPDNVVMDSHGEPRLIDFGLAMVCDAWNETALEPGVVVGSASYMAPEQARGDHATIGPSTDIFALGTVLYFLLMGRAPFESVSPAGAIERAAACDFDQSQLLSTSAPRHLIAICLRAMAAEPSNRYRSAVDLASELESCVTPSRQRSRQTVGIAIMTAALLTAASMVYHWGFRGSLTDVDFPGHRDTPSGPIAGQPLPSGQGVVPASVPTGTERLTASGRPRWDRDARELQMAGRVVRHVRSIKVATNIVPILDAFEKAGWPPDIASPFPASPDAHRLKDAIASLNDGLQSMRFYVSADEKRACWRIVVHETP